MININFARVLSWDTNRTVPTVFDSYKSCNLGCTQLVGLFVNIVGLIGSFNSIR